MLSSSLERHSCKVVVGIRYHRNTALKLGARLQGGEEEVSDGAMETTGLDRAFEKCASKGRKNKT